MVSQVINELFNGDVTVTGYTISTGGLQYQYTNKTFHRSFDRTKEGNWDRPKPEILEPSPYSVTARTIVEPYGEAIQYAWDFDFAERQSGILGVGYPQGSSWEVPSFAEQLLNEALIDALMKVKDQRFNAGVAIAEAEGTAALVVDVGESLAGIYEAFVTANYGKAYKLFRTRFKYMSWSRFKRVFKRELKKQGSKLKSRVPDCWLYYHLGILPALSDIDSLHQDWWREHKADTVKWHTTVTGRSHVKNVIVGEWGKAQIKATDMTFTVEESYRVFLSITPKNGFVARMASIGATNLPEALWNRIPYSFVFDYFFSLGDWLSVLDAGMGWEFGQTVESYRRRKTARASHYTMNVTGNRSVTVIASPFRYKETSLNRRVVTELYPPMFRVLPKVKLKNPSMTRIGNMLALLKNALGKGNSPIFRN